MIDKERREKYKKLRADETSETKACFICLEIKPVKEFSICSTGRKKSHPYCKSCAREYDRKRNCRKTKNIDTIEWLKLRNQ